MKLSTVGVFMIVSMICLESRASHAQAWRCEGDLCEDAILNSIEDAIIQNWPTNMSFDISVPYSCSTRLEQCPSCAAGGKLGLVSDLGGAGSSSAPFGNTTQSGRSGTIPWTVTFTWGALRSFLLGSDTAGADFFASVTSTSGGGMWANTSINYLFQAACGASGCDFVRAPGGSTGVVNLGSVSFSTTGGDFWNASVPLSYQVPNPSGDFIISCSFGFPGHVITVPGGNLNASYSLAWTPIQERLADEIRNQFGRAARLVVTGVP